MTGTLKKILGQRAEEHALHYLTQHGLSLISQNFRCKRGEIDLIMRQGEDIIFVEVRSRSNLTFGHALESITYAKQRKIMATAIYFLQHKNWLNRVNFRFDVVSLSQDNIEWIKDAFSTDIYT